MKPVQLSPAARDILRESRPSAPLFSNSGQAEAFEARNAFGPLRVLPRTDGTFAVYDERKPFAQRTVSVHATEEEARRVCNGT